MALKWINERVTCSELDENFSASAEAIGSPVTKSPSQEIGMQPSPSATNDWSLSGRFAFASWTNCTKKNYFAEMENIYLKRRINWVLQYPSVNWTPYNNSLNVKYCLWSWKPRYPVCYTEGGSWQASSLQSCWPQLGSQIVESKPCAVVNYYRNKERKVTNSGVGGL